jgi:hypothetical protein
MRAWRGDGSWGEGTGAHVVTYWWVFRTENTRRGCCCSISSSNPDKIRLVLLPKQCPCGGRNTLLLLPLLLLVAVGW